MKVKGIILTALIVTFYSCDFLEEEPIGSPDSAAFYENLNEVQLGVNATYEVLTLGNFQKPYAYIGSGCGDNLTVIEDERFSELARLFTLNMNSLDPTINNFWGQNYKGIFRANQVISSSSGLRNFDTNNLESSRENLRELIAEAKFLRAFFYFNLVRTFGGVPIKPEVLTLDGREDNFIQPRSSLAEVYEYIEKDLREAIIGLETRAVNTNIVSDLGRVTGGAALSLLLKVLVYQATPGVSSSKWEQADLIGAHIVDRATAELTVREILDFENLYQSSGTELERIKFDLAYDHVTDDEFLDNIPVGMGNNFYNLEFQYAFFNRESADFTEETVFQVNHVIVQDGSADLVSPFHKDIDQSNILQPMTDFKQAYSNDPRAIIDVMTTGTTLPDGTVVGNPPFPEKTACYKWYTLNDERSGVKNFTILRYADVVLLYAEATNEMGDQLKAMDLLNQVRSRARNIVNAGDPRVTSSTDPADYGLASYLETRSRIWRERRVELAFEFDRFWDLNRTGQAQSAFAAYNAVVGSEYRKNFRVGISQYLPIPLKEIDATGGIVEQNPGY